MRSSYIPSTNNGLVSFSKNLVTRLTAQEGHFGVPSQRLASLSALQADFADAQAQVTLMTNRPATARRNAARAALLDEIRGVVAIVRAQQDVTDAQKITLGLTIPGKRRRAIPRPRVAPRMIIHAIDGHRVHVMLFDQESDHYRRPRDVAGAAIFLHVGEQPSRDPKQWKHVGDATRARHTLRLPGDLTPGTPFWLVAAWYNPRVQRGPASSPVGARVPFGVMTMAA